MRATATSGSSACRLQRSSSYRRRGLLPGPTLPGKRYDKNVLDRAMDKLSGIAPVLNPLDDWNAHRGSH